MREHFTPQEKNNNSVSSVHLEELKNQIEATFHIAFDDFLSNFNNQINSKIPNVDEMSEDEFFSLISSMLLPLEKQERDGAFAMFSKTMAEHDSEDVLSARQIVYLDAKSIVESHNFAKYHSASMASFDASKLNIGKTEEITYSDLIPSEILLLSKIDGKSSVLELPGYFTAKYTMNYQNSIQRLFSLGYLTFGSFEYRLNKLTLAELKKIASEKNIKLVKKKQFLITDLLSCINDHDMQEIPQYFVVTEKGKNFLKRNAALLLYFNAFADRDWTSPDNIISEQNRNYFSDDPVKLSPYQILSKLLQQKIDSVTSTLHFLNNDMETIKNWEKYNT